MAVHEFNVTVAPATGAPLGSATVPESDPCVCANKGLPTELDKTHIATKKQKTRMQMRMPHLLDETEYLARKLIKRSTEDCGPA